MKSGRTDVAPEDFKCSKINCYHPFKTWGGKIVDSLNITEVIIRNYHSYYCLCYCYKITIYNRIWPRWFKVPFTSPIVGGHVFTPWKGRVFTISKRSRLESPGTTEFDCDLDPIFVHFCHEVSDEVTWQFCNRALVWGWWVKTWPFGKVVTKWPTQRLGIKRQRLGHHLVYTIHFQGRTVSFREGNEFHNSACYPHQKLGKLWSDRDHPSVGPNLYPPSISRGSTCRKWRGFWQKHLKRMCFGGVSKTNFLGKKKLGMSKTSGEWYELHQVHTPYLAKKTDFWSNKTQLLL